MAITPGAGYMIDPNNPNGVVPIGSQGSINNPNAAFQNNVQGAPATASTVPSPTVPTPASPVAVNPNKSFQENVQPAQPVTQPASQPAAVTQSTTAPDGSKQTTKVENATQPLQMPSNGSVVDLLNMAGQDSSYSARQKLAQQYGIQGYTGTAAQNADLSKKYIEAFNSTKGMTTPETSGAARSAVSDILDGQKSEEDPQKTFFDQYMSMNPVMKSMYDTITQALSTPATTQTFEQEYAQLQQESGLPALQTQYMNIKNIMDGTEDDIRDEIQKAGGFATESQVQAMTAARNKTLIKQANTLQDQIALKEDYVDHMMQFSQLDRKQVSDDLDRKLGLTEKLADIQTKMTSAATDNYQKIVAKVGYQGLADSMKDNPQAQAFAEQSLGLPKGALSSPSFLALAKSMDAKPLQFVSGTANQSPGYFDPNTGKFTPYGGSNGGSLSGGDTTGSGQPIDSQSGSLLAQTGLSIQAFNYLTQGVSSMSRLNANQRTAIMSEANNWLNKNGIDISTFQSRYDAYNKVLQGNVQRTNAAQIQENELLGTIENLDKTISDADLSALKGINVANLFAGKETNNPVATKYATYLASLRNELAGYNAAVRGNLSAAGGPSPDQRDLDEAEQVLQNGIAKGSLGGFKDAVISQQQKMGAVLDSSVDAANKSVWDLFGVGGNYKPKNPNPSNTDMPKGSIAIERNGQRGYITNMMEFDPKTDKII